jgi:hypothetical protein
MKGLIKLVGIFSILLLFGCYDEGSSEPIEIKFTNLFSTASEEVEKGDTLGKIDAQTNFGDLKFEILEQSVPNAFAIDPETGWLTVNNPSAFDHIQNKNLTAIVSADNGLIYEEVLVSISIEPTSGTSLVQTRLDNGETPYEIYLDNPTLLDDLYGAKYAGGLIFYLNTSNGEGLVAAEEDQGLYRWGCSGKRVYSIGKAIGDGWFNTYLINKDCNDLYTAAKVCSDLVYNNYNDWFLPSRDELNLMHQNLHLKGYGNFKLNRYWSSTEYSANNAYCQFFNMNTNQLWYDKDLIPYYVRAVREF